MSDFRFEEKRFSCQEDAQAALKEKSKKWKYHLLANSKLTEHKKHKKRGRPVKGTAPTRFEYQIEAKPERNEEFIESQIRFGGCYVIGTNASVDVLTDADAVIHYMEQNKVEQGFRFLKDPIFFVSSLFVKKPSRIAGLLMVMTLSLLVYSVAERKLRKSLKERDETLPNQINKPIRHRPFVGYFRFYVASMS